MLIDIIRRHYTIGFCFFIKLLNKYLIRQMILYSILAELFLSLFGLQEQIFFNCQFLKEIFGIIFCLPISQHKITIAMCVVLPRNNNERLSLFFSSFFILIELIDDGVLNVLVSFKDCRTLVYSVTASKSNLSFLIRLLLALGQDAVVFITRHMNHSLLISESRIYFARKLLTILSVVPSLNVITLLQ